MKSGVVAIVLNWCAEDDTAACVQSLQAQTGVQLTTLIVDNASPDKSGERLAKRFPDVPFLQTGANLGYAGGNARGITWALEHDATFVFVVNDDTVVDPRCIATLVAALVATQAAGAAGPTIVHESPRDIVWSAGSRFDTMRALSVMEGFGVPLAELPTIFRPGADPRDVSALSGCAMLLRASTIKQLGGFREDFFAYVEDTELSVRWRNAGVRLLHVPSAMVVHKTPYPPPSASAFHIHLRDRNRRRLARLHFGFFTRARFLAWFVPTRFALALGYLVRGELGRMRALARGAFDR